MRISYMKWINSVVAGLSLLALGSTLTSATAAEKNEKLKPYTLDTCVVSDEKLGEMGKPFVHEYKGREIKFCCKSCLKDFNKNPDKYVKKIEAAEAKKK